MATSYNWLFLWDYTFYKWGYEYLYLINGHNCSIPHRLAGVYRNSSKAAERTFTHSLWFHPHHIPIQNIPMFRDVPSHHILWFHSCPFETLKKHHCGPVCSHDISKKKSPFKVGGRNLAPPWMVKTCENPINNGRNHVSIHSSAFKIIKHTSVAGNYQILSVCSYDIPIKSPSHLEKPGCFPFLQGCQGCDAKIPRNQKSKRWEQPNSSPP